LFAIKYKFIIHYFLFADVAFTDEEQQQQQPKESLHEQAARKLDSLLTKRVSDEFAVQPADATKPTV
jgi:hypothetical protein